MKIVLLYSGGLDSIGALWELLTESDHEILVQHVKIDCEWKHWEAEKIATDKSLAYIKKHCRDFTVLPDVYYKAEGVPIYSTVYVFFGTIAAIENNADRLYTGNINGDNVPRLLNLWNRITNPLFSVVADVSGIQLERPFLKYFKDHWMKILPQELINFSHTCRYPTKQIDGSWKQCGKCACCIEFELSSRGIFPPDDPPEFPAAPLLFPSDKKNTLVILSKCNNGIDKLKTLLKTGDIVGVQFVDIQNSKEDNSKEEIEKELIELQKKYKIIRLEDRVIKTHFSLDNESLVLMYSICAIVWRYSIQLDRIIVGELTTQETLTKIKNIRKLILRNRNVKILIDNLDN